MCGVNESKAARAERVGRCGEAKGEACGYGRWRALYEAPFACTVFPLSVDSKACPASCSWQLAISGDLHEIHSPAVTVGRLTPSPAKLTPSLAKLASGSASGPK
jgi:hypothetical protein